MRRRDYHRYCTFGGDEVVRRVEGDEEMSRNNLFYQIVVDIVATAIGDKTSRSKQARRLVTVLSFAGVGILYGVLRFVIPALKEGTLTVSMILWGLGILTTVGVVIWILVRLLRKDTVREKVCKRLAVLGKIIFGLATVALIVGIFLFFAALAGGTESLGGKIFWMAIPVVIIGGLIVCIIRAMSDE